MCGRFAITLPPEDMRRLFDYCDQPDFPPRHNIAPTQPIPIVRAERRDGRIERRFQLVRWAFLPSFAKDPRGFPVLFNARAEGISEKPSFRNAARRRRCLVPADAFYEWHRVGSEKTGAGRAGAGGKPRSHPYLCRRADGLTMGLAGLWETWMGPDGEEVDTACIITTEANGTSVAIHPRLPAIIEPANFAKWLDPDEAATEAAMALLRSPSNDVLTFRPIGDAVNKVDNDDASILAPIGPPLGQGRQFGRMEPARPVEPPRQDKQPSLF